MKYFYEHASNNRRQKKFSRRAPKPSSLRIFIRVNSLLLGPAHVTNLLQKKSTKASDLVRLSQRSSVSRMPYMSYFPLVFTGVFYNISTSMPAAINDRNKILQISTEASDLFQLSQQSLASCMPCVSCYLFSVHEGGMKYFFEHASNNRRQK
jgi:hypothetical protein